MEETVISLETAKLLKEKGYRDELCRHYYDFKGNKNCITYEEALEEGLKQALKLI